MFVDTELHQKLSLGQPFGQRTQRRSVRADCHVATLRQQTTALLHAGLRTVCSWPNKKFGPVLKSNVEVRKMFGRAILPSDGIETSSENGGSYVTSRCGHTGYSGPIVCSDVVDLNGVEVRNTIKASHHINVVVE